MLTFTVRYSLPRNMERRSDVDETRTRASLSAMPPGREGQRF
jgi:hypothetical protein